MRQLSKVLFGLVLGLGFVLSACEDIVEIDTADAPAFPVRRHTLIIVSPVVLKELQLRYPAIRDKPYCSQKRKTGSIPGLRIRDKCWVVWERFSP